MTMARRTVRPTPTSSSSANMTPSAPSTRRNATPIARTAPTTTPRAPPTRPAADGRGGSEWEAPRIDYDARYGYGSYVRIYGPAPVWNESNWSYWAAPSASYYGRDTAYVAPRMRCGSNGAVAGGVIGAIAG